MSRNLHRIMSPGPFPKAQHRLGTPRANADSAEETDYECEVSCIDWYGNARPIFTGGRNLALVNSEIIEGEMVDGRMRELRRLNILTPPRREVAGHLGTPGAP